MLKKLIRSSFSKLGYEVARKTAQPSPPASKAELTRFVNLVRPSSMVPDEGLACLYDQARFCEEHHLAGDFVECGVWKGGSVAMMALVNLAYSTRRRHIHLFDVFEEICEPDERVDGERALREVRAWSKEPGTAGRLTPLKGVYDHMGGPGSIEENKALLEQVVGYDPDYIHYHKGWFQHTLPEQHQDIEKIVILRIDADWYASTKVCLEYLFRKVVPGGFLIIDDYGAYDGCRIAVDEFVAETRKPLFLNCVNDEIRYIINQ